MVALEISLTGDVRAALPVAFMAGDAVEGVQGQVSGQLGRGDLILLREEELQRGALGFGKRIAWAFDVIDVETASFVLL